MSISGVTGFPRVTHVLHTSAFSCRDVSGPKESLRIEKELRKHEWVVGFLLENVVSRELEGTKTVSSRIGVEPVFVETGGVSYCRRARLYWLKSLAVKAVGDFEISDKIVQGGRASVVKMCVKPALDRFL
jgi:hypothetical protein